MSGHELLSLSLIVGLGMAAQWLAWKLHLPSILFLLLFGFIAGPLGRLIFPDVLFGDLLFPLVSISVALILFEGGLTLRFNEIKLVGGVVLSLITVGLVTTWAVAALAAYYLFDMSVQVAVLIGAILVVTGPTVIGPLLLHVRPAGRLSHILKWEGILIDPIGALLAVITFEVIYFDHLNEAGTLLATGILKTIVLGGLIGFAMARILVFLLKRFWIPDFLRESASLSLVIITFVISNYLQPESGLFAVTLMGLFLDNQKEAVVHDIVNFKETLRMLLISSLFIILSARLDLSGMMEIWLPGLIFVVILIVFARPLSVFLSTINSKLDLKEKTFLSWMAPRGIIAAAVASAFSLRLSETDLKGVHFIEPLVFFVITATVAFYGLTSRSVACRLKLARKHPQGVLFLGAHPWVQSIALELQEHGFNTALIDMDRRHIKAARLAGLRAYHGNALTERMLENIEYEGLGKFLAMTRSDQANSLGALHYAEVFDKKNLYQLIPAHVNDEITDDITPKHLRGRYLFQELASYQEIQNRVNQGFIIKSTHLTEKFGFEDFMKYYKGSAIPLFVIKEGRELLVFTTDNEISLKEDDMIIALVKEDQV